MEITITLITTGILGLIFMFHTVRVIIARDKTNTSLGDGGNNDNLKKIRTHANFAEYIPLLLFILLLLEIKGVGTTYLYIYSTLLIAGRILHAHGILGQKLWSRVVGMIFTMTLLTIGSLYLIFIGW